MVKERPILFNGAMVRAILEVRKTVTRRQIYPQFPSSVNEVLPYATYRGAWMPRDPESPDDAWEEQVRVCPYGKPGDRLWVRETWSDVNMCGAPALAYRADGDIRDLMAEELFLDEDGAFNYVDQRWKKYGFCCWYADLHQARWRPSIHMPRWASRILLEITDVRVERLQAITYEQAAAEGIHRDHRMWFATDAGGQAFQRPEQAFAHLWRQAGGDWDANPWVWVVEFKRVEAANV